MLAFMGGMLGQGMPLKARCPALAYANICLYVFSFVVFIRSAFLGRNGGCSGVCIVLLAILGGVTPQTAIVNTPLTFVLAGISTDLQAAEQRKENKKAWLKPSNVHNKGKLNVSFQDFSPQCMAICQARRKA